MYSYEDRIRVVKLYIKCWKRTGLTIRQLAEAPGAITSFSSVFGAASSMSGSISRRMTV